MIFRVKVGYRAFDFKNDHEAMAFAITAKQKQVDTHDDVEIELKEEDDD